MTTKNLYRLSAFTNDPTAGNPAGVWVGDQHPNAEDMQSIAADIGFSETAFVMPTSGFHRKVRYFSPENEVPFCGHATIATAVQLARLSGEGKYIFDTAAGEIPITVRAQDGKFHAALTSVEPKQAEASNTLITEALAALGWNQSELDPSLPAACAYAGAWHLILATKTKARLDDLDYQFDELKTIMLNNDLTTLQLVWRESPAVFHSRNPFPVGGVVEDPATGAAAAALGGYLRSANLIDVPAELTIHQGEVMGQPSLLRVEIPNKGGIVVKGTAVVL